MPHPLNLNSLAMTLGRHRVSLAITAKWAIISVIWPLLQLYDTGDNETGLYALIMAVIDKRKVRSRNGTYSAYSLVNIVSYAHPAPFTSQSCSKRAIRSLTFCVFNPALDYDCGR